MRKQLLSNGSHRGITATHPPQKWGLPVEAPIAGASGEYDVRTPATSFILWTVCDSIDKR